MTALWIILGIFAFLFLLLLCPITLTAGYETQLEAKLRFLFFSYRLAPKKEKKPPKKGKAKKQEEGSPAVQESKLKQLIKERGFAGFLRLMKELAQLFKTRKCERIGASVNRCRRGRRGYRCEIWIRLFCGVSCGVYDYGAFRL